MLTTVARYVYKVYQTKNVSQAASELFISQPALSAAIKRAEEELGAPIFNRKTLPLTLTPEGKVYIEAIERMLAAEAQMNDRIRDIRHTHGGRLRIGIATRLAQFIIPALLKTFHEQYPSVDVHIENASSRKLPDLLENETVDMLFSSIESFSASYTTVPLFEERLTVAVRRDLLEPELVGYTIDHDTLIHRTYDTTQMVTDLTLLRKMEFTYTPPNTNLHKKRRILLSNTEIMPYVLSNTGNLQFHYNLMLAGVGACLSTDAGLATIPPREDIAYLPIGGEYGRQTFGIIYPSSTISPARDAFIQAALAHFTDDNPLPRLANI